MMKMTGEQTAAIKSRASLICVDAAAGSGKTRILVERIVHLLEHDGVRLDQIVAFTFMEKAAAEMKARLRKLFRKIALDAADDPNRAKRWRELSRGVDSARVTTIHGFCMAVLRENALRLGADPDAAMLGDGEGDLIAQQAVADTLHEMLHENDEHALRLVVGQGSASAAKALGGALRRRSAFRTVCGSLPMDDPGALLTEWRKRCAEEFDRRLLELRRAWEVRTLLERLTALDGRCPDDKPDPRAERRLAARDAFAAIAGGFSDPKRMRALLEGVIGIPGSAQPKRWDDKDAYAIAGEIEGDFKELIKKVLRPFAAEDEQTDEDAARLAVDFTAVARRVMEAYDAAKAAMGTMDFDDLIDRTRAALRDNTELRARVAGGMRHLLVDEFQDTDRAQYDIADALARCGDGGPALFVVGDPKQSIYLFRGADVGLLRDVRARAGKTALPLSKNFRSLPDVLEFVNDLFSRSDSLAAVEDYRNIGVHRAALNDAPRVEVHVSPKGEDGKPLGAGAQAQAEAKYLARRVRAMVESGQLLAVNDDGERRPVGYGDIAVLFRKTTHTHLYEEELREAGVPYCRAAGEGFYERQEIMDVLHLLKAVTDPWNEPALLAFLRGPMACLSDDEIVRLRMAGGVARAFNTGEVPGGFPRPEKLSAARQLLVTLRGLADLPCGAFLRRALELTRFEPVLLGQYQGLQKASNLRKLVAAADGFARRGAAGLRGFVQYVDDLRGGTAREGDANLQAEGGDAVVLLTVHKAKGLEFPVVFVAGMGAECRRNSQPLELHPELGMALNPEDDSGEKATCGMTLAIRDRGAREQQAEEARTLYVALTRARDYLVLMGPPEPKASSWFGMVNRVFGVAGMAGGAEFNGEKWRGVVCRDLQVEAPATPRHEPDADIDMDRLRARIAPIAVETSPERRVFSVSEVLNRIFGDGGEEERGGEQTGEQRQQGEEDRAGRSFAMARGTLAHRLFEDWDFAGGAPPEIDELVKEARLGLTRRERLREELGAMSTRFRDCPLHARLAADSTMKREEPFLLALDGAVIRGTIDALLGDGTVIDYKTGSRDEKKEERYGLQLALYAAAVRLLLGKEPREGLLYYADLGETRTVPLNAAALDAAVARTVAAVRTLRGADK